MKKIEPEYNEYGMTQWYWGVICRENFVLGKNTEIGTGTVLDARYGLEIEDSVLIGWNCSIFSDSTIDGKKGKVILRENCKIGANSVILPNVIIGKNAIIGASSLVKNNVPKNEVWAGIPAKKICDI